MSSFLQQLMSGVTAPQIGMAGFAAGGAAPQIPLLRAKPIKGLGGVPAALANTASNVYAAALTGQINQALAATAGGLPASGGGNAAANQALALRMLPAFGWGADQMPYLIKLWNQESNWSQTALNQSSGAYGIPQSLPASKMASAGPDWRTNPATQIKWGLGYIKSTYGNPAGAWGHEVANNWYASGGRFPAWAGWNATGGTFVTRGPTLFGAGEGPRPERITVAPADNSSATGGRPIHIEIHHIIVNRKGDVQKIVDEELALLAASLRERQ